MQNLLIKINNLKAINYSRKDDSFDVVINFNINDKQNTLTKHFAMGKRFDLMGEELVENIKSHVKNMNKPDLRADFMEGIIVVRYNDIDEVKEKVSMFFKRFNDSIKGYKDKRYVEGFLMKYSTPDGFSMRIE